MPAETDTRRRRQSRAITCPWVALCVITIGAWEPAPGNSAGVAVPSAPITVAVITLGFIKSRLIIRYFMQVRTGPGWLKHATDAWWWWCCGAAVSVIYLF